MQGTLGPGDGTRNKTGRTLSKKTVRSAGLIVTHKKPAANKSHVQFLDGFSLQVLKHFVQESDKGRRTSTKVPKRLTGRKIVG